MQHNSNINPRSGIDQQCWQSSLIFTQNIFANLPTALVSPVMFLSFHKFHFISLSVSKLSLHPTLYASHVGTVSKIQNTNSLVSGQSVLQSEIIGSCP